jgi:hypothetical protein
MCARTNVVFSIAWINILPAGPPNTAVEIDPETATAIVGCRNAVLEFRQTTATVFKRSWDTNWP